MVDRYLYARFNEQIELECKTRKRYEKTRRKIAAILQNPSEIDRIGEARWLNLLDEACDAEEAFYREVASRKKQFWDDYAHKTAHLYTRNANA